MQPRRLLCLALFLSERTRLHLMERLVLVPGWKPRMCERTRDWVHSPTICAQAGPRRLDDGVSVSVNHVLTDLRQKQGFSYLFEAEFSWDRYNT